jgi:hypothetical protein
MSLVSAIRSTVEIAHHIYAIRGNRHHNAFAEFVKSQQNISASRLYLRSGVNIATTISIEALSIMPQWPR